MERFSSKIVSTFLFMVGFLSLVFMNSAYAEFEKGQNEGMSPLIRIFNEDRLHPSAHINAFSTPSEETLQVGNTEFYYVWKPKRNMIVAKIQFYSSAPDRAFIRLFEALDGKPGALLAEVPFKSKKEGWQGISFPQASYVQAGTSYFISYAHENDVKNCFTVEEGRKSVSTYWMNVDLTAIQEDVFAVEAPSLKSVTPEYMSANIQWDKVTYDYGEYNYLVYRNGEHITTTQNNYFIDEVGDFQEQEKQFIYTVKALQLDTGMFSNDSNSIQITIQNPIPQPSVIEETSNASSEENTSTNLELTNLEQEQSEPLQPLTEEVQAQLEVNTEVNDNELETVETEEVNTDDHTTEAGNTDSQHAESTNTNSDPVASVIESQMFKRRLFLKT